ncbi:helix-turn-helix domain-containing protein [Streptomyces sp. PsTaAH-124]|uniref:helix-turn-helix domain-containing protein n=1 Tax=Streptomyces sp. PsTaAH-124 TaxID=1157638 RepID=UPI00037E23AA|nr:helix-turn-helix transcriptional regulator [Streptomyces sp. PsTaAH-124]
MTGDDFAGLLRELKERSGLSYGALGKRLHMSASTVHRYVSGDVVPTDYAPVERLARLCRATPDELLELHRRWVRADALRGTKGAGPAAGATAQDTSEGTVEDTADGTAPAGRSAGTGSPAAPDPAPAPALLDHGPGPGSGPGSEDAGGPRGRRRPTALLAGAGIVAVAAATALVVHLVPGGRAHPSGTAEGAAAAVSATGTEDRTTPSTDPDGSASPSLAPSRSASAPPSSSAPGHTPAAPRSTSSRANGRPGAVPVTVGVTPYYWDVPCEQSFLVDRSPKNVPPPPGLQDVVGWGTPLGAVAADRQMVVLTVQGSGAETVVLQGLHVRVVRSDAPLTWNSYAMSNGCGGGVDTKSFDVSLDLGNPLAQPIAGQRNFPYKVSESDPEVFYVNGHTAGHDVSWYLELDWSSGDRHGTVRVDDHGKPFRTSGAQGRPRYVSPLGGHGWERELGS